MIVEGKSKHDYSSMIKFADALSYNFQFDSCLAVLDKAILKEPERPEAFLVKSRIYLWYFLGSREVGNSFGRPAQSDRFIVFSW